ncbi:MAG: hypothetical protein ACI9VR_002674 [Cognaticolwellia sp.]|jgi:hypothetical protein
MVGGWLGATPTRLPSPAALCTGPALLPQAGVALGMALVASQQIPEVAGFLPIVVLSTVVFELFGPLLTRLALRRMSGAGM